jgi:tRNA pseudouridine38-40 synthase
MHSYVITVSYDGTEYAGWQVQNNALTVMGVLYKSFAHVFSVDCTIVGASRTDSGVHAHDQVARVQTSLAIDPQALMRAWNNALPPDITIRHVVVAPEGFHPQFYVDHKVYWYHVCLERPLPFFARFGWWAPEYMRTFNQSLFEEALSCFVGTHNFSSFAKCEDAHPVRAVDAITVEHLAAYKALRIEVRAKGFLRYQIRRMVGSAMLAAQGGGVTPDTIRDLLTKPQQSVPGILKAAPEGLTLQKIVYESFERE